MALNIEFKRSRKTFEWDSSFANILDFAEAKGIQIENGCRIGVCGTCKVKMISGTVVMDTEDALNDEDKTNDVFLPCVGTPQTDLVIEA